MSIITELFNQKEILNYLQNREYPAMLGDTLFPAVKRQSLEFDMIRGAGKTPVVASVHGFDTETEIGERQAQKMALELALIKRKMQLKEKDIIALEQPRNASEREYLMRDVFNDIDTLVQGVKARIEAMRMEVLANGIITVNENNLSMSIDYEVPSANKEVLTLKWTDPNSNPLEDLLRWYNVLTVKPTRILTSNTILMTLLTHPKIVAMSSSASLGIVTNTQLDAILSSFKLPPIATYDEVYKKQATNGSYTSERYFPENKLVMFNEGALGETIYGPTAEEIRLMRDPSIDTRMVGNILAMVYEESVDPVSTWTKAVATALPSFAYGDEVFQAEVI